MTCNEDLVPRLNCVTSFGFRRSKFTEKESLPNAYISYEI